MRIGKKYDDGVDTKHYGKTIIITGSNSGIGYETARECAKRGAKVILACRDLEKCEKSREQIVRDTFNRQVECRLCDLASLESIRSFAEEINKNERHVDVLINNAGVMWCPKKLTKNGFETHLGVNHFGHFYLTNLLLNKLKQSSPSRIVNVSCHSYKFGSINFDDLNSTQEYDEKKAYDQSKLANVLFTIELAKRLQGTNVSVNSADPGTCDTDILRNSSVHGSIGRYTMEPFMRIFMRTANSGAQTLLYCALSPNLKSTSGKYFSDLKEVEIETNNKMLDDAKRLWAISKKWTRLDA